MARAPDEVLQVRGKEETAGAACLLMRQDGSVFSLDVVAAAEALKPVQEVSKVDYDSLCSAACVAPVVRDYPPCGAVAVAVPVAPQAVDRLSRVNGSNSCVVTARRVTVDIQAQRRRASRAGYWSHDG